MNAVSWLDGLPPPEKWRAVLHSRGPQIAVWVLALALGVQLALIVTDLAGARTASGSRQSLAQSPVPVPAPPAKADIAAVANSHLFGVSPASSPTADIDAANAPRTSMPLVLTGIIAADDPRKGFAIVGQSATAAKVYAVGDNVPGGARLHSVYGDRVLLERAGQVESLTLPRQLSSGTAAPIAPVAAVPADTGVFDRMRRMIAEDPGIISDIMRPQAVFSQGKQRGYRVYPGRNRQAFVRLGLRPGDLVIAINGTPLDDPARGQEIFRTLGSSSEAQVTVVRNGRQQDVTLNIAQVASEAQQLTGAGDVPSTEQVPQMPPADGADAAQ